jgi:hypothetical protein
MMDADQQNIWGPNHHVFYGKIQDSDKSGITVNMWDEGIDADSIKSVNNWDALRQDKIDLYKLYTEVLENFHMDDIVLTMHFCDAKEETSFLTIEDGEITYDVFA